MHIKFDKKWRCKSSCVYFDRCHMSRWLSSLIFCYLIWILIQRLALSTLKNVSTVLNVYLRIEMFDKYRKIKFQLKSNQFMKTLFFLQNWYWIYLYTRNCLLFHKKTTNIRIKNEIQTFHQSLGCWPNQAKIT